MMPESENARLSLLKAKVFLQRELSKAMLQNERKDKVGRTYQEGWHNLALSHFCGMRHRLPEYR